MNITDEIKSRVDIVELVSETVKLRRSGKNYTGFCPFHTNTRTPSFVVFPDTGTWRCFSECNDGGDIFKFVMKKDGYDFPQALKHLAERAGVRLEPLTPKKKEENERVEKLRGILEEAVTFFRYHLLQSEAGKPALAYLLETRKLTKETIESFELGYAPNAWEATLQHLTQKGYSNQELLDAGLLAERQESGGYYDKFRNRIIFPIRDSSQRMCGFGGRILDPNDIPKFLNSPQTALFNKSSLLYGLDKARRSIRQQNQVVIVEGYLDVIALHQAGFSNAVSPMGTALTEAHLRQLKRYTPRIVMAMDPDAAGQKATLRGLEIARDAMDHSTDFVFDTRGLMRHEARLQSDLRVCTLPEGKDPDDIVLENPEHWRQILQSAKPILTHVMDTLSEGQNLDDPKVKSDIAGQVLPLIKDVPNAVERDAYRQQLARLLKVNESALLEFRPARPRWRRAQSEPAVAPAIRPLVNATQGMAIERHCLTILCGNLELLYLLDRMLQKNGLARFASSDFEASEHQQLAEAVQTALLQDLQESFEHLQEHLPEEMMELYDQLNKNPVEGTEEQIIEDLTRSLMGLRRLRINNQIEQIQFVQQDLAEQGSGSSGCNQYQAAYEVNEDALTISQAAMTLMACTELEGIMEQERLYLELLGSAERFQLTDEELLIYGAGDALFSFIPLP